MIETGLILAATSFLAVVLLARRLARRPVSVPVAARTRKMRRRR